MKFLRPLFLKHLFVLRFLRACICVYASSVRRRYTTFYHETSGKLPGWKQGEGWGEFGPPQKLICNFNIPLFIPIKSAVQRFNGRLRRGGATHRVQVSSRLSHYGQQCITADPEFMGLHWIRWNAKTCKCHRWYWETFFIKFACPCINL